MSWILISKRNTSFHKIRPKECTLFFFLFYCHEACVRFKHLWIGYCWWGLAVIVDWENNRVHGGCCPRHHVHTWTVPKTHSQGYYESRMIHRQYSLDRSGGHVCRRLYDYPSLVRAVSSQEHQFNFYHYVKWHGIGKSNTEGLLTTRLLQIPALSPLWLSGSTRCLRHYWS